MVKIKPDIYADIHVFTTEEGGRRGPIIAEYFNCPLEFEGEYFECQLILKDTSPIELGSSVKHVPIIFLTRLLLGRITIGSQFKLWSGKDVAQGTVTEVCWSESDNDPRPRTLEEIEQLKDATKRENKNAGELQGA